MRSVGKIATLAVAAALTSGVLVSSAHAASATEGATKSSAALWPCIVQAKWAVKVHKRKSLSSGYRVAKKGTSSTATAGTTNPSGSGPKSGT